MFHLWVKACEESGTGIYRLTGTTGHGVYETKREYMVGNTTMYEVRFHLWWHGHHELVSRDYAGLVQIFEMREKNGSAE